MLVRCFRLTALAAAVCVGPAAVLAQTDFSAQLDLQQEVPAPPPATGTATLALNDDETELSYEIRVTGLPNISAAHFHQAAMGVVGGVVHPLAGTMADGVWVAQGVWSSADATGPLTAELVAQLRAGNLYVNIHTPDYPGGEIRGQILTGGPTPVGRTSWGQVRAGVDR
ncbi:MAG: CHRD domain-containing protein [Candidatus Latescibacterota bacterium]